VINQIHQYLENYWK